MKTINLIAYSNANIEKYKNKLIITALTIENHYSLLIFFCKEGLIQDYRLTCLINSNLRIIEKMHKQFIAQIYFYKFNFKNSKKFC